MWVHTPGMGLNDVDDSKAGITKYLERNPRTSFVAVQEGNVVGVILCGHDGRRGFIHHTAVALPVRRTGVATALLAAAVAALEREGISKVALVVFGKNELGNAFWESQGFAVREDLNYRNKALRELVRLDTE